MIYIKTFILSFWDITLEMSPYLLLGFFISGCMKVYFNQSISKHLKDNSFASILKASILGIPLPLCSCGVIPAGVSLYKSGASKASTISFLISTPQTGLDSILATYGMLGWPLAIFRPFAALVSGVFGGVMCSKVLSDESSSIQQAPKTKNYKGFWGIFKYAFGVLFSDIAKHLLIGLILASLIGLFIPDDFGAWIDLFPGLDYFIMLTLSIPLYVCATGSIPIAAVLIMKGISPGAAFVFLMAGPATNIATINVIQAVLGKRSLMVYLASIVFSALLFGWVMDHYLQIQIYTHLHDNFSMVNIFSSIVFLGLIAYHLFFVKYFKKVEMKTPTIHTYIVTGMSCTGCKNNVESSLSCIEGIEEVKADPSSNQVCIKGNVSLQTLKSALSELGFKLERKVN